MHKLPVRGFQDILHCCEVVNPLKTALCSLRERPKDIKIFLFNPIGILHGITVECKSSARKLWWCSFKKKHSESK